MRVATHRKYEKILKEYTPKKAFMLEKDVDQSFDPPKVNDDWTISVFLDVQRSDVHIGYIVCSEKS